MKPILLATAAVCSTLTASLPATAQGWYGYDDRPPVYGGPPSAARLLDLIDELMDEGVLRPYAVSGLRAEVASLSRLEARYRRDGLSTWERRDLRDRYEDLEERVEEHVEDSDWDSED